MHKLGSEQSSDHCLYHEKDDMFSLDLEASESKKYLFISSQSKNTQFVFYLDVAEHNKGLVPLTPRIDGIDTLASHRGNQFFIQRRTEELYNSELLVCPLDDPSKVTVILPHRERYFFFYCFCQYVSHNYLDIKSNQCGPYAVCAK